MAANQQHKNINVLKITISTIFINGYKKIDNDMNNMKCRKEGVKV